MIICFRQMRRRWYRGGRKKNAGLQGSRTSNAFTAPDDKQRKVYRRDEEKRSITYMELYKFCFARCFDCASFYQVNKKFITRIEDRNNQRNNRSQNGDNGEKDRCYAQDVIFASLLHDFIPSGSETKGTVK